MHVRAYRGAVTPSGADGRSPMMMKNYYLILGVPRDEQDPRGIRDAYRQLAKQYHPERAGPEGATAFRDVVEAYEVLSHDEQRVYWQASFTNPQYTPRGGSQPPTEHCTLGRVTALDDSGGPTTSITSGQTMAVSLDRPRCARDPSDLPLWFVEERAASVDSTRPAPGECDSMRSWRASPVASGRPRRRHGQPQSRVNHKS